MRVDVIGGGEGGSKDNVHWTLSVAMVEFRLSPYLISLTKRLRIIILRSKGKMFFQWNNRVDLIKHI